METNPLVYFFQVALPEAGWHIGMNFKTFMTRSLFILRAIAKYHLVFIVTNYIGAILYLLLSHTALQAQTAQMPAAEKFSTGEVVKSTPAMG